MKAVFSIFKAMPKNNNFYLKIVYGISFLDLLAIGISIPLLAPHLHFLGASHITVGLLKSLYSGLQFTSGPIVGSWSDVRGTKFVLLTSLMISSLAYLCMGLTSSLILIAVIRIILGCFKHTQTLCRSMVANMVPRSQQAKAFGLSSALGATGFIIGPLIGGYMSELSHGFLYMCILTTLLFTVNIGLALLLPDKQKNLQEETSAPPRVFSSFRTELHNTINNLRDIDWNTYWEAFAIRFLFGVSVSMYFSNEAMYLKEKFNLPQVYIGYVISFVSTVGTLGAFLLGFITENFYRNDHDCSDRLFHFFLMLSLSYICMHMAPNVLMFLVAIVPFGLASILIRLVSMELILAKPNLNSNSKGSISGACNSIMSVSRFVSPLISGIVCDLFGEHLFALIAFVPSAIATGICWNLRHSRKIKHN